MGVEKLQLPIVGLAVRRKEEQIFVSNNTTYHKGNIKTNLKSQVSNSLGTIKIRACFIFKESKRKGENLTSEKK